MRHAYLHALHASGSANDANGWSPRWITLWRGETLAAACVLYVKTHSMGEYVFDQGWARAYAQHGLAYYPKAVIAVPFTPVPGSRLLAVDEPGRDALLYAALTWCRNHDVSSLHLLFGSPTDLATCQRAGLALRHTVQFHWDNWHPAGRPYRNFDDFLQALSQDKRKKIRQERRKVADAGVRFRWLQGADISPQDWDFFLQCYERTYLEHGNPPYLNAAFFEAMAARMTHQWLLGIAERDGQPIATSLIALHADATGTVAYGRYWGAMARVDCLHFEACYYQPLQWCIANGVQRFEGGAQGEHKLARALLPVRSSSAHWLADTRFAGAVRDYLQQEGSAVDDYLDVLRQHSPLRKVTV